MTIRNHSEDDPCEIAKFTHAFTNVEILANMWLPYLINYAKFEQLSCGRLERRSAHGKYN